MPEDKKTGTSIFSTLLKEFRPVSKRRIRHLCLALLISTSVCAGCATNDGAETPLVAAQTSQLSQSTGTVVVTHRLLARAVPADVTHIRYTGKNAKGEVHYPATRRPKAATVQLSQVPTSVTQLQIELLSNDTLVGQGNVAVSVVANGIVTVQDPAFSDVGLRPQNRLNFVASQRLSVGACTDTASSDFNGDTFADVVATNSAGKDVQISFGLGNGRFTASQSLPAGAQPQGIAVADVNKDGKLDIVSANSGDASVSVLLGKGDGTFADALSSAAGNGACDVATGDLNLDGKLDLVTANRTDSTVSVLFGQGDGTFLAPAAYAAGQQTRAVAVGDVNGDGRPDVVAASSASGTATLLFNSRFEGLSTPQTFANLAGASGVTIGDLDGDGLGDVGITAQTGNSVTIALGNTGTTLTQTFAESVSGPTGLLFRDVSGDGQADILVSMAGGVGAMLFEGAGFAGPKVSAAAATPQGLTLDDFNGDGTLDYVVADAAGNAVVYAPGLGDGMFQATKLLPGSGEGRFLVQQDFNNDGKLDLAGLFAQSGQNELRVFVGDGKGNWTLSQAGVFVPGNAKTMVALGGPAPSFQPSLLVYTEDGKTYELTNNGSATFVATPRGDSALALGLFTANLTSSGAIPTATLIPMSSEPNIGPPPGIQIQAPEVIGLARLAGPPPQQAQQLPVTLAIGDVNADGLPDVVSYWNTHMVLSYLATGVGNQPFSGPQVSPDVERIAQLLIAPLTGDDHADIALIDDSYQVRIMPGDGQGKFAGMPSQASYLIGQAPTALQAADMDKDGLTDLVFSLGAAGGLTVLFQDNGAFFTRESWGYGNGANGVVLGDYNGDNMPDMAQVGTGGISVYLSQPLP